MTVATSQPGLNAGQTAAAEGFLNFLFNADKEMTISGPAGTGKTFLMAHLIDQILPQYRETCKLMDIAPEFDEVIMTATTNKAAEVLGQATKRDAQTIQSYLNLTVKDDPKTGASTLSKTKNWKVYSRKIIFIDEAYMIDTPLHNHLMEGTSQCKIVYVGDHCQLNPVMEPLSPIVKLRVPFYELTEPMRNADQPALKALCDQLRNTVETGVFHPIQVTPGVVDWFDAPEMEAEIERLFKEQTTGQRMLAYTNDRVLMLNDHVRGLRQLPAEFSKGELLISNSMTQINSKQSLKVEQEVEVVHQSDVTIPIEIEDGVSLEVRLTDLKTTWGSILPEVRVPVNKDHHIALIKHYAKVKNWKKYFFLKNDIPDLRPREAATVHKAQGSTYDTVVIDLGDISRCRDASQAARLLYVAFSRAKSRVIMYGELAQKFGGLIAA